MVGTGCLHDGLDVVVRSTGQGSNLGFARLAGHSFAVGHKPVVDHGNNLLDLGISSDKLDLSLG